LKYAKYFLLSVVVILIDQAVKLAVYQNMVLNTEFSVLGDWFRIHYILNSGMAFGLQLKWEYGKLTLTVFRMLAMVGIGYYLVTLVRKQVPPGLCWSIAMILGGAVGNLIDSVFYGVLLNNAPLDAITPWFHGQVIDMLYFPIIQTTLPDWLPIWGAEDFEFFRPIFNIADASIFIGVVIILIFQKRFFPERKLVQPLESEESTFEAEDEAVS
jgi:signal peptidase II